MTSKIDYLDNAKISCLCLGYDWERIGIPSNPEKSKKDQELSFQGVSKLLEIHTELEAPCTFFVLGKVLEIPKLKSLFKDITNNYKNDFIEIGMHSYSHLLIRDHDKKGEGASPEEVANDFKKNRKLIEKYSNRIPIGASAPQSFYNGLQNYPKTLRALNQCGIKYIRSDGRDIGHKRPAPIQNKNGYLRSPYSYKTEGFSNIIEIPAHGYSDNYLKGLSSEKPETEWSVEFEVSQHLNFFDKCIDNNIPFVPMMHPWSIATKDPEAEVIGELINYSMRKGIPILTYNSLYNISKRDDGFQLS